MHKNSRYLRNLAVGTVAAVLAVGADLDLSAEEQSKKSELPPAKHYTIDRAASKIKIDGVLNEKAWETAAKITTFYEWTPGDNTKPPVETECLVTYDKSKFYVAFRCFDPQPQKIRAHLMDRDAVESFIQDDHIYVMLDTYNAAREAFQFRVNPLGVQMDAKNSEIGGGFEDFSWDAIWESAGRITDSGYVVELAIPFNQLRFARGLASRTWGFSASRSYPRSVRHRMDSHVRDRNKSCQLCQHNKITGMEGISPGKNIEIGPTLTVNRTDRRDDFPDGEMAAGKIKAEPGVTVKWGITPNLILNGAVNPDFSQVEADVAQLEVNTRFSLYYPEKRPFFLEGADFFLTPVEAVFTRTVVDPLWGTKLTGKVGKSALGFIAAQDRYTNLLFPSNQGSASFSMQENVYGGVLRYRRDVGKGSMLGALYTGRVGDDYYNHVAGADGFFRLSNSKTFSFQYLHSWTDYPGAVADQFGQAQDAFDGRAIIADFSHVNRNWIYALNYQDLSAGFRADYGFVSRVDVRRYIGYIERRIWKRNEKWFNQIGFILQGLRVTDSEGNLTDQIVILRARYFGPLQTYFTPAVTFNKELYNGVIYEQTKYSAVFQVKPVNGFRFDLSLQAGDSIDYANSRLASSFLLQPGIELSLGKHLNLNLSHIFQQLSLEGEKIYTANLFQTRIIYNFNVRTFIRAIVQYTDIDRSTALYTSPVEPRTKGLFTQLLFSYKINPQTVLFLGYSDNHLGIPGIDLTQTNRTFFLKIGYALVL